MSIEALINRLVERRRGHCIPAGIWQRCEHLESELLGLLFPHFAAQPSCSEDAVRRQLDHVTHLMHSVICDLDRDSEADAIEVVEAVLDRLPEIAVMLDGDARAMFEGDPASRSIDEVILSYPGFHAIAVYRLAHVFFELQVPLLPRLMSELVHRRTGIDIHPGAKIGRSFFIDHGTGVVVGETSEIGNSVKIYQGVTLGSLAVSKALAGSKRHPTIQDNVVIYANATVLGGETVIGNDSIVGASAWVTSSVPPFSIVGRHSDVRRRSPGDAAELEYYI